MQIAYSLPSSAAIAQLVTQHYALPAIGHCRLLLRGVNDSYLIQSGERRFVARLFRHGWRSEQEIREECQALRQLAHAGVKLAAPIATRSGDELIAINAAEGERWLMLSDYACGQPLATQGEQVISQAYAYGRGIASIHAASSALTALRPRLAQSLASSLHAPVSTIAEHLRASDAPAATLDTFHTLSATLDTALAAQLAAFEPDYGFCHADTHGQNAHLDAAGEPVFFDFDFCAPGWRAFDLASYCWNMHRAGDRHARCSQLLAGYRSVRPLADADLALVPYLVSLRHLWWWGLNLALAETHGDAWMDHAFATRQLDFLSELQQGWQTHDATTLYFTPPS